MSRMDSEEFKSIVTVDDAGGGFLIVDIQLPGITGLELQGKLAGAGDRLRIVVISAQGTNANREKSMKRVHLVFSPSPSGGKTCLKIRMAVIAR
jgi:FixJ family two-component response regulator